MALTNTNHSLKTNEAEEFQTPAVPVKLPTYIEIKKEDHTIRFVFLFMLGFLFLLFLVDIKHEITLEQHQMDVENRRCLNNYVANKYLA